MFEKKTVFVVGAGGSHELGLPLGSELKNRIARKVSIAFEDGFRMSSGDHSIYAAVTDLARNKDIRDTNPWWRAGRQIAAAMVHAPSIDNFLHLHSDKPEVILMGKLGIVSSILEAERQSALFIDRRERDNVDFQNVPWTWHASLVQMLIEGVPSTNHDDLFKNVGFITFNYDRCIEQYLAEALRFQLLIPADRAQALVSELEIIHPYGQVGKLPWQDVNGIPFGSGPGSERLSELVGEIRTFTERVADDPAMDAMQSLLRSAEQVIFLGFAYAPINLELLGRSVDGQFNVPALLGTSVGISPSDESVIRADLRNRLGSEGMRFTGSGCSHLFGAYGREMTF